MENRQPRNLMFLFFTEMWERFSFYGMRALLTLYLTIDLFKNLQDPAKTTTAYGIYAAYGALVYATPFIGGWLSDKYLGHKRSVLWGAILMAIGHFIITIPTMFGLYTALAFLILGNGFFKPNISSLVGTLYEENDPRRDAGFTIFYMGINLGGFLSPLICGFVGEYFGWHYGFGIAGIGMLIGLAIFYFGKNKLVDNGVALTVGSKQLLGFKYLTPINLIYVLSILSLFLFGLLIKYYQLMSIMLTPIVLIVLLGLFIYALRCQKVERERLFVVLILLIFTTIFFAFFEQAGTSMTMFTQENINRNIGNFNLPTSIFQSANPMFILILAPLFSMMWMRLEMHNIGVSTPMKFVLGLFLLSISFFVLSFSPRFVEIISQNSDKGFSMTIAAVPMIFILLAYLFQTIGELCLSPIGLSMVTRMVSPKIVSMVMGIWFLSSALAHNVGGIVANFTTQSEIVSEYDIAYDYITNDWKNISENDKNLISGALYKGIESLQIDACNYSISNSSNLDISKSQQIAISFCNKNKFDSICVNINEKINIALNLAYQQMVKNATLAQKNAVDKNLLFESALQETSISAYNSMNRLFVYTSVFKGVGIIALVSTIILLILVPIIKKMMHEEVKD